MAKLGRYHVDRLTRQILMTAGRKCCFAGGGEGVFTDHVNGDHLICANGATVTGGVLTLDGVNQYAETAGVPVWAPGFAGDPSGPPEPKTYNGSGISVAMLIRVQPGDLAGRMLIQFDNSPAGSPLASGTDWTNFNLWIDADGLLWCWCRSHSQEGAYLTGPVPSDRLFHFRNKAGQSIDFRPLLADGQWHLVVISRGTFDPPEAKSLSIDGKMIVASGTGNMINLFKDPARAFSFGRLQTMTLSSPPALAPFKGEIGTLGLWNRWLYPGQHRALWGAAVGGLQYVPWWKERQFT